MSIEGFLLGKLVDNVFRAKARPIQGSVVYCDLISYAEHSGIYVGDNTIVHLNGSGDIEAVSPSTFMQRLSSLNPAFKIYVSCYDEVAVGSEEVANRAIGMVGSSRSYNLLLDNCHQFTSGCLSGNFGNSDNFMWMLKDTAKKHLRAKKWRVWNMD